MTHHSTWAQALTAATPEAIAPLLADGVELTHAAGTTLGRAPVSRALADLIGDAGDAGDAAEETRVIELDGATTVAVRRDGSASGDPSCFVLRTEFDPGGRATAMTFQPVQGTNRPTAIEHDNPAPEELLGARVKEIAEGIAVSSFGEAKRVNKRWGNETWLHTPEMPFGFKVIRLRAGHRTSLQYHEKKLEIYFVLDGLARLHFRADDGAIRTVPFIYGTVATVQPLAWHRVEAVTDVTLVEASTYDDGSDNIRVEDDYGRASGRIDAEHGSTSI